MKHIKEAGHDRITDPTLKCQVCKIQLDSKNKLMKHLKETGHAVAPVYF